VALSQSPGEQSLPHVRDEAAWLRGHTETEELIDAAATVEGVRGLLGLHAWLHFAGHGSLDTTTPGRSGLHLHDGILSVGDVAGIDLAQAELAYLSSCESSTVDPAVPDEPLHIAGAMLMAGYRHVIAASWVVGDEMAAELSQRVYSRLLGSAGLDTHQVAQSLHQATRAIRAGSGPESWAAHLHSGV
jgi:CHAT domain-containing protein